MQQLAAAFGGIEERYGQVSQQIVNVPTNGRIEEQNLDRLSTVPQTEQALGSKGSGVRASGTEPVVRVMVEGENQ